MKSKGEKGKKGKGKGKLPDDFKLENKRYPYEIYRLLSSEQKNLLRQWAQKDEKRRMIKMIRQEMKKPAGDSGAEESSSEEEAEEQAGKQFGRKAHKKAKKSKS